MECACQKLCDDLANPRVSVFREGVYVRVIGSIRSFMNKRSVNAVHISTIKDYNEVTHRCVLLPPM